MTELDSAPVEIQTEDTPIVPTPPYWAYVDDAGRVLGANPNDMTGNSGWTRVEGDPPDPLTDARGVPLYVLADGVLTARPPAEMDEAYAMPAQTTDISLDDVIEYMTDIDLRLTLQEMGLTE